MQDHSGTITLSELRSVLEDLLEKGLNFRVEQFSGLKAYESSLGIQVGSGVQGLRIRWVEGCMVAFAALDLAALDVGPEAAT